MTLMMLPLSRRMSTSPLFLFFHLIHMTLTLHPHVVIYEDRLMITPMMLALYGALLGMTLIDASNWVIDPKLPHALPTLLILPLGNY